MLKFLYHKTVRTLMWTATMTRSDSACAVRGVASGALLKDGDEGYTLPASHERVGDHVWGCKLSIKASTTRKFGAWVMDAYHRVR